MKKLLVLTLLSIIAIHSASARVTPITDWPDSMAERTNPVKSDSISCAEKCPGYDVTTTYCYGYGEELESCPEDGCGYYHRCVPAK